MYAVKAPSVLLVLLLGSASVWLLTRTFSAPTSQETLYYAYAIKGKLAGYMQVTVTPGDGIHLRTVKSSLQAKVRLLGFEHDIHKTETYRVEPATRRIMHYEGATTAGPVVTGATVTVKDGTAYYVSKSDGPALPVQLSSDVLFHDPFYRPFFTRDLPETGLTATYRFLSAEDGLVHRLRVTRAGEEELNLPGRFRCAVFEMFDENKIDKTVIWIDLASSRWIKMALSDGSTLSMADAGIVSRVERTLIDDMILTEVDANIPNYRDISSMSIRVKLRVSGEAITAESLNVTGQRFRGAVRDGIVEGVFDTQWPPLDNRAIAPFPPRFYDASLSKYFRPEPGIESADPEIRKYSVGLTRGASNAWDGAERLAGWVAREIRPFAVGGSARQTLQSRQGACQSYASLLAAFCRSVGIPARLVYGCMYLPRGSRGVLGGHVWTEIYVGDAGWIAVDANHGETTVLDSGHIRLGSRVVAQPLEAEILKYTLRVRR